MKILNILLLGLLFAAGQSYAAENERWYSDEQLLQGEKLFRQNCAACHAQKYCRGAGARDIQTSKYRDE